MSIGAVERDGQRRFVHEQYEIFLIAPDGTYRRLTDDAEREQASLFVPR